MVKKKIGKKYYIYKSGKYLREELDKPKQCKTYRVKEVKKGVKILLCITGNKKRRKTKAVAILRDKKIDLRKYKGKPETKKAIKKARKIPEN